MKNDPAVAAALIAAGGTLAGVIVTLIGSVVAPMVRESIRDRAERRRALRIELRTAISEVHAGLVKQMAAVGLQGSMQASVAVGLAINRLELLLSIHEVQLSDAAYAASVAVRREDHAPQSIAAWSKIAAMWHRGEIKASRIRADYDGFIQGQLQADAAAEAERKDAENGK